MKRAAEIVGDPEEAESSGLAPSKVIRVVHVITGLKTGGAEIMLLKLLRAMPREGSRHTVISLTSEGDVGKRIADLGIPVIALRMRGIGASLFGFCRLVQLLRRIRPQVTQTWLYHADLIGGLAARAAGGSKIVWGIRHANLDPGANKRAILRLARISAILSRTVPHAILCNAERARSVHAGYGYARNMDVIPNGFEIREPSGNRTEREAIRLALEVGRGTKLIGWVGRFHPQKDPMSFVKAALMVSSRAPDAVFLMAGEGLAWDNFRITDLLGHGPNKDRFRLLGKREDIPSLMTALDLFVSSSQGEGFPNAVGEAMVEERPCIVTDVGDSAYLVGDTGWVVPPRDPGALAEAMLDALRAEPEILERKGRMARDRVLRTFEIGHIALSYLQYYRSLLRK